MTPEQAALSKAVELLRYAGMDVLAHDQDAARVYADAAATVRGLLEMSSTPWWRYIAHLQPADLSLGNYEDLPLERTKEPDAPHSFEQRKECMDSECGGVCWVPSDDWCGNGPAGPAWSDSDGCTLPHGHAGPHAMFSTHQGDLVDTCTHTGRRYYYMSVWQWEDEVAPGVD